MGVGGRAREGGGGAQLHGRSPIMSPAPHAPPLLPRPPRTLPRVFHQILHAPRPNFHSNNNQWIRRRLLESECLKDLGGGGDGAMRAPPRGVGGG